MPYGRQETAMKDTNRTGGAGRVVVCVIMVIVMAAAVVGSWWAFEKSRMTLAWWYSEAQPTIRTISMADKLLNAAPNAPMPTDTEEFHVVILERSTWYRRACGPEYAFDDQPVDAWGRPLHFSPISSHGMAYDVWSAGADGESGNADDIGNWSTTSTTHERYADATRLAGATFCGSVVVMTIGMVVLFGRSPIRVLLFFAVISGVLFGLYYVQASSVFVDPGYAVPTSAGAVLGALGLTASLLAMCVLAVTSLVARVRKRWKTTHSPLPT